MPGNITAGFIEQYDAVRKALNSLSTSIYALLSSDVAERRECHKGIEYVRHLVASVSEEPDARENILAPLIRARDFLHSDDVCLRLKERPLWQALWTSDYHQSRLNLMASSKSTISASGLQTRSIV